MICGATFIDPLSWTLSAVLSHGLPLTRAHGPDTQLVYQLFPFPSATHLPPGISTAFSATSRSLGAPLMA